jgi:hypothetical protein
MPVQPGTLGGVPAPETSIPRAALTRYLRELPNYVVLRNEEDLFGNVERGGDIDLLVGDAELAERTLIHHLGPPIRIVRYSFATLYFFDWGHIDLVRAIEWQGACYLRTEAILEARRLSAGGRPVPRIAHEAVISWLTSLLWGAFFKERYAPVIRQAVEADGLAFEEALKEAAGNKWGQRLWRAAVDSCPEVSGTWVQGLRRAVWWRAFFNSPMHAIRRYLAFVMTELRRRFAPPVPWIAISGADRNGTSSLGNEIVNRLVLCPYMNIKPIHWSPSVVGSAQDDELLTNPHERARHARIGSGLGLVVLAVEWVVNYWTLWVRLRTQGYILVFQHTYFDLLVDPTFYGYRARPRLARALSWLLPRPDFVFLLDSEPDVLGRRKEEGAQVVHPLNASLPLSLLADEVQRVLRASMLEQSIATLRFVHNPITTPPAVTAEVSTIHTGWLGGSDAER